MHKNVELPCSFFVVPGNSPLVIWIPDCERLQLPSANCKIIEVGWRRRHDDEKLKQGKSKTNGNSKINPLNNIKINQAMDHFIAGPWREAHMTESAKITQEILTLLMMYFKEYGVLKAHFHCRLKKAWKHTRPCPNVRHTCFNSHSGKN